MSRTKLEDKEYYDQEIFNSEELAANLDKKAAKVEHSVYVHVIYDRSTVEKPFAVALDNDPFFNRFKIETAIGN